jgi:ABC-2 type transport system ATP-binding protein
MDDILSVEHLSKTYRHKTAVKDVCFSIRSGEIVGLLGGNGAGKTTTIDMILGIVTPTTGSIRILGKDFKTQKSDILGRINFVAPYAQLPSNLTVRQNLMVFSHLYNVPQPGQRVEMLLKEFDLVHMAQVKAGLLSSGEQSRLGLAKALINKPLLLLLDEPTASLDPHTSDVIRKKLKKYTEDTGAAILWTSHDMFEVEMVCDRVFFIKEGSIILEGSPKNLPQLHGAKNLQELFVVLANQDSLFSTS